MARADRVPLLRGYQLPTVRVIVNGVRDLYLAVDTGAYRTMISHDAALTLGIDVTRPLRFEGIAGVGEVQSVPVVRLDSVQVGGSIVRALEASVYDLPPVIRTDGLLDLNFLQRSRVTFDFAGQTLVLRAA